MMCHFKKLLGKAYQISVAYGCKRKSNVDMLCKGKRNCNAYRGFSEGREINDVVRLFSKICQCSIVWMKVRGSLWREGRKTSMGIESVIYCEVQDGML